MKLVRVDIFVEVSMLLSHPAIPSRFHLEKVLHMFGYIKKHQNADMEFDPSEPSVAHKNLKHEYCSSSIYGVIKEELTPNITEPRGLGLRMIVFMDSNHTGDSITR